MGLMREFSPASGPRFSTPSLRGKDVVLTRPEIESMIAEGKTIVIVNNRVLRVDSWLKFHPGGDMAILHMVGRDATDEVTAYVGG